MADIAPSSSRREWFRWVALAVVLVLLGVGFWALRRAGQSPGATVTPGQTVSAVLPGVGGGDPGIWELADPASVTSASTSIAILVTRLGCASGRTGTVLVPVYALTETAVILRTDVAMMSSRGAQTCPGNDQVPITVVLPEPIGNRSLVDGACSQPPAASTSSCFDKGVRRPR